MKYLVISDSHGETDNFAALIEAVNQADAVIHLGDGCDDVNQLPTGDKPVFRVRGNCDKRPELPNYQIIEDGARRILMTHGHHFDVKYGLLNLALFASEQQVDIAFYGHTHVPYQGDYEGIIIVNPGSVSRPKGGSHAGYVLLDCRDDDIVIKRVGMK